MFLIRLERDIGTDKPVSMWLKSIVPHTCGERDTALKFESKGDARRAVTTLNIRGAWYIEPE
jgi:hypothetical protein